MLSVWNVLFPHEINIQSYINTIVYISCHKHFGRKSIIRDCICLCVQITTLLLVYRLWSPYELSGTWKYLKKTGNNFFNTLRPRQNGRHFADDIFKCIFFNENISISIKISLVFVLKGPINNIPALVQIMAWRRPGDKPLSEPRMEGLLTHICVTRPQWVNPLLSFSALLISIECVFERWGGLGCWGVWHENTYPCTGSRVNACYEGTDSCLGRQRFTLGLRDTYSPPITACSVPDPTLRRTMIRLGCWAAYTGTGISILQGGDISINLCVLTAG